MDPNGLAIKMFIPFSNDLKPLLICVNSDCSVDEVIGFSLYAYVDQARQPPIPEKLKTASLWNLRIVEDDGEIDDDFPGF
jgi:hypothetical protein